MRKQSNRNSNFNGKHTLLLLLLISLSFSSCKFVFYEAFYSKRCMKCKLINDRNGQVLESEEECAGFIGGMEERYKAKAYDYSQRNGPAHCDCEMYKKTN